jgi:hypothetical protein
MGEGIWEMEGPSTDHTHQGSIGCTSMHVRYGKGPLSLRHITQGQEGGGQAPVPGPHGR